MQVLGIIGLIIAGGCFLGGIAQQYITQQAVYFLCWLGFGLAGMGFLVLDKLSAILTCFLKINAKIQNDTQGAKNSPKL